MEKGHSVTSCTKFSRKVTFLDPTQTHVYISGGKNVSFLDNFALVLSG